MKRITEITRRDIFDIVRYGYAAHGTPENYRISWHGRLDEIAFLKRLYNLRSLPSYDGRYENAEGDIWQHRVNNLDWDNDWILEDDRFQLVDGNDETLLNFLCEMLHPVVRDGHRVWRRFLNVFNELLKCDGYELYEKTIFLAGLFMGGEISLEGIQLSINNLRLLR